MEVGANKKGAVNRADAIRMGAPVECRFRPNADWQGI
jgi:hypothetical protein